MKRANRRHLGEGALELIEEAIHLLRRVPAAVLAGYYVGAGPFVLGLLYFWGDMSHSAFAARHLTPGALGVALLFLWMKFWQAIFAGNLRALLVGESPALPGLRRCRRIFIAQTALQPSGLFLLPLSLIPALPFGWAYAFYQNLTALGDDESGRVGVLFKRAARQTSLWQGQNHLALAVLSGFGLFVFLNWITVCLLLPGLVKTLFGVETMFSRSVSGMLNTTFFMAMTGVTYLCVDPIVKAFYALRCFYGQSLQSGEDLKVELKQFAARAAKVVVLMGLVLFPFAANLHAGTPETASSPPPSPPKAESEKTAALSPSELDRAIQETIQQRKYTWRMPREKVAEPETAERGVIGRFLERVGKMLREWVRAGLEWLGEWLKKLMRNKNPEAPKPSGYGWIMSLQILLYVLVAAVVVALVSLLYRVWREREKRAMAIPSEPIRPAPDLADENVSAQDLPEDAWTKLARELLERGELRLALRAFYLASLANLAERNLISLAKFKSNRDYQRELHRRGHSFEQLLSLFGQNVSIFDRIYYGLHEVNGELVGQFAANVERIRSGA